MALPDLSKFSLQEINKWPMAFILAILGWTFYSRYSDASTAEKLKFANKTIEYYQHAYKTCDSTREYFQDKYNNKVEADIKFYRRQDSITNSILREPALKIINATK